MSRAGQPGGRFDARYEAHSVSAGARDDLEQPFGQNVEWWAYDVAAQQVDSVYDVGVPAVGGRVWKGPYRLPVISAHQIQGKTPQQNHEGFFNADRLRLVVRVDTARQVGLKHIADHPDQLLADRVQWRGQVYKPEGVQPRGIVGHDRYLIVSIDATQIRPDELINDPSFPSYQNELPVTANPIVLRATSRLSSTGKGKAPVKAAVSLAGTSSLSGASIPAPAYGAGAYGAGAYGENNSGLFVVTFGGAQLAGASSLTPPTPTVQAAAYGTGAYGESSFGLFVEAYDIGPFGDGGYAP